MWGELFTDEAIKIWVAAVKNKILGFLSICPSRDSDRSAEWVAEISALYISPEYWHKGTGRALCDVMLVQCKMLGYREVDVWVLDTNTQAQSFYESVGFCKTKIVKEEDCYGEKLRDVRLNMKL